MLTTLLLAAALNQADVMTVSSNVTHSAIADIRASTLVHPQVSSELMMDIREQLDDELDRLSLAVYREIRTGTDDISKMTTMNQLLRD